MKQFSSLPFSFCHFARAKHWIHLKPRDQILPVKEITLLFLEMPLNLHCQKPLFPPPSAFSQNYLQCLLGKQNHDILHFSLVDTRNTHMKRLGSWIYYFRVMEMIIILYITTRWDWVVWWSNMLWNVSTFLQCPLEGRGAQCLCPCHNAEHYQHPHCILRAFCQAQLCRRTQNVCKKLGDLVEKTQGSNPTAPAAHRHV